MNHNQLYIRRVRGLARELLIVSNPRLVCELDKIFLNTCFDGIEKCPTPISMENASVLLFDDVLIPPQNTLEALAEEMKEVEHPSTRHKKKKRKQGAKTYGEELAKGHRRFPVPPRNR